MMSINENDDDDGCGDDAVWLLSRETRSLDILSVKKEAKLSASETHGTYRKVRVKQICGVV